MIYYLKISCVFINVILKNLFNESKRYLILVKFSELFYFIKDSFLPKISIDKIINTDIFINPIPMIDGNLTDSESLIIARFIIKFQPENVFEFGTFNGRTTLNIAKNSKEKTKIFSIDLSSENAYKTQFKLCKHEYKYIIREKTNLLFQQYADVASKIELLIGDSATFDYSPYLGTIDFVFIDGSHSYEYVINDTLIALKLLRHNGGIIMWHDYNSLTYKGLTKAINEFSLTIDSLKDIKLINGTSLVFADTRALKE